MVSTELPTRRRSGFVAHGVNNHGGKWVVKPPIEIGVCRAWPFALLFANQCSAIRSQPCLLTPYIVKPNSIGPQYCVSWESSWPRAGLVLTLLGRVISLIHRSICQSRLRSQPVRLANYFANKATILENNAHGFHQ